MGRESKHHRCVHRIGDGEGVEQPAVRSGKPIQAIRPNVADALDIRPNGSGQIDLPPCCPAIHRQGRTQCRETGMHLGTDGASQSPHPSIGRP
jgi:hypothetical protein